MLKPSSFSFGQEVRYTPVEVAESDESHEDRSAEWCASFILLFGFIAINAIYVIWLLFYIKIYVHPVPRNALNKTEAGFYTYQTFLYMIGVCVGFLDTVVALACGVWNWPKRERMNIIIYTFLFFLSICLVLFVIAAGVGGSWIIPFAAQAYEWTHGCDSYPMYAILTGGTTNIAYFYNSSGQQLYTYTLATADFPGVQQLTFDLSSWETSQASISADMYPTLQNITYNLNTSGITGSCATPLSQNKSDCVNGTFTKDSYFPLNLTSTVPLGNDTQAPAQSLTSELGPGPKEMLFASWTEAALILRQLNAGQNASDAILRTAVHKLYHCRELKVCINGVPGRGPAGAEVLVPMGLLFQQHAQYASWCFEHRWNSGMGPDP
ncbi:hypothetical protein NM688_g491 [Phlebia brevispora]|uniref:Uncharacterized protein n=1 Tax=Phlebia brevispora TaxID=194682 RepID=A0ACC1TEA8_9APHY|nr:hypothetical protein NM688_g491 [Phlebia brevispora]